MALKLLQNTYRQLQKEPVEGFCVEPNEANFFEWKIYVESPSGTPYEGGIFEMEMKFPSNFPMAPPKFRFVSEFWHPNVYKDGTVCISILHPPGEDAMSGELPGERWLPTQTVETIVLSVLSIIGDPNFSSPANVDASVECQHRHAVYVAKCKALAERARSQIPKNVKIPHPESDAKEREKAIERHRLLNEEYNSDNEDFENYDDFEVDYGNSDAISGDSDIEFNYSGEEKKSTNKKSSSKSSSSSIKSSSGSKSKSSADKEKKGTKTDQKKSSSSSNKEDKKASQSKSPEKDKTKEKSTGTEKKTDKDKKNVKDKKSDKEKSDKKADKETKTDKDKKTDKAKKSDKDKVQKASKSVDTKSKPKSKT